MLLIKARIRQVGHLLESPSALFYSFQSKCHLFRCIHEIVAVFSRLSALNSFKLISYFNFKIYTILINQAFLVFFSIL